MSTGKLTILLMPVWVRDRMLEVITLINGFTKRRHYGCSAPLLRHRILSFSENEIFSSDVHIQKISEQILQERQNIKLLLTFLH